MKSNIGVDLSPLRFTSSNFNFYTVYTLYTYILHYSDANIHKVDAINKMHTRTCVDTFHFEQIQLYTFYTLYTVLHFSDESLHRIDARDVFYAPRRIDWYPYTLYFEQIQLYTFYTLYTLIYTTVVTVDTK